MSGCIGCANQPGDNGSLGGAGHEGSVTPMVIGIIIGTVLVFILVVCALFYCVKLENNKYMAKIGDGGGGGDGQLGEEEGEEGDDSESVKSRPSSVTIVVPPPSSSTVRVVRHVNDDAVEPVRREAPRSSSLAVGASVGRVGSRRGEARRKLFAWGKKSALPADTSPVTAIEMV